MAVKRFIQVGTGGFGAYWCETVLPRVREFAQPIAAVDVSEDALMNAQKFLGVPPEKCYADLNRALLETDADFVIVVVPALAHEAVIDAAIDRGLDIVCEKPLGGDMAACARIHQKVMKAGRKLAVTMSHRLEVEKQTVQSLVQSGAYGNLLYLVSRLTLTRPEVRKGHSTSAEAAVASLINNGMIHNLDTMRGVSGSDAKTVYANGFTSALSGYAEGTGALVVLEMENGVRAQLEMSYANAQGLDGWSNEYLRAECDHGTIIADHGQVSIRCGLGYPHPTLSQMPLRTGLYWDHALVLRDFVRWLDGGEAPATNLEDNMGCCALTYAAIESAMTGQAVDVRRFMARHMA